MSNKNNEVVKTKVGGQALIEGVMMLGPKKGCMAVRKPDKTIYTEQWDRKEPKWYNKAPFIRGCVNFVSQMADGYNYINKSGEISGMFDEEEDEKAKSKKKKDEQKTAEETVENVTETVTENTSEDTEKKEENTKDKKEESSAASTIVMVYWEWDLPWLCL